MSGKGNRWLGPIRSERHEAFSLATSEDNSQNLGGAHPPSVADGHSQTGGVSGLRLDNMSEVAAFQSVGFVRDQRPILEDISWTVDSQERWVIVGPNGAGKTTCFYMIVGLVDADAGDIRLDEQSLMTLPMHRRARAGIGYLPQEASVFRQLSVRDNLLAILETRSELSRAERHDTAEALLEEFNVGHLAESLGQALSGGERRRVEIARALATEPTVILLDEPFAGVDPISISDIKNIITHLKDRGIGVLITDHNVRETLDICERAYIVGEGHVIASGTPDEVLANDKVRETYLGEHFSL